jgi:2-phospho-L-lactate/phosphoenolpyruvate guanylyltransferase
VTARPAAAQRGADLRHLVAIVPVRTLEGAKSRLGGALDAEERQDLVRLLLERTVAAARLVPEIEAVLVVSPDPAILELASRHGARPIEQRGDGLNEGLAEAATVALGDGATAILVIAGDLPSVSDTSIGEIVATAAAAGSKARALVVVVPDRHGRGTNALLLSPPGAIRFAFGTDSRSVHQAAAHAAGALSLEVDGPLSLDLDLPEDLTLAEERGLLDPAHGG